MLWFTIGCLLSLTVGIALLSAALRRHRAGTWSRLLLLAIPVGLGLTGLGLLPAIWLTISINGNRSAEAVELAPNISYERENVDAAMIHWATVNLDSQRCIDVVTSTPDSNGLIDASTGTEFGQHFGADLAVNVSFFYPIQEYPHWSSYPTSGDPITSIGQVVASGKRHGIESEWQQHLIIDTETGTASIEPLPNGDVPDSWYAVPGRALVLDQGAVPDDPAITESSRYPRTVAGVDSDNNKLVLAVVDGKQFGYSRGLSLDAVGRLMADRGVDSAIEFDGGGSSTMVGRVNGNIELLSRPSHTRIPGRQRPVATFLGFTDGC